MEGNMRETDQKLERKRGGERKRERKRDGDVLKPPQ